MKKEHWLKSQCSFRSKLIKNLSDVFWLGGGGTGGVVFAWLLIGTLHLDTVLPLIKEYHLLGA